MLIDGNNVTFKNNFWTPNQINTAMCLGFDVGSREIQADLRITSKKALWNFMKMTMSTFKKDDMDRIAESYGALSDQFNELFLPTLQYPNWQLRQHQIEALKDMAHRQYNLLAFTMGLGKTITSASLSKMLDCNRTVIVCPALVKWNWYRELTEDWGFNALEFTMIDANDPFSAINERFVITNFEMIEKYQDHILGEEINHIIVDEAHNIKNVSTKKHQMVQRLANHNPAARVTLLTGTPITNRVDDLFGYLSLFKHHLGRSKRFFIQRYTKGRKKEAINVDELRVNLSNCMIRKKTSECIDLPAINIRKFYFNISDYGPKFFVSKKIVDKARSDVKRLNKLLEKDPGNQTYEQELFRARMAAKNNIHTLNRIASEFKVPGVCKLADTIISEGRKVIIFSPYRKTLNMLQEYYGKKCVLIDGSVEPKEKQRRIQSYLKKDYVTVFLGQLQAAGVGINLVNSCDVIFNGFPFTPDLIEQPIKRAHRMGQVNDVNVYFTIGNGSYDDHIYDLVASKLNEINDTIDYDKDDILEMDEVKNSELKEILA